MMGCRIFVNRVQTELSLRHHTIAALHAGLFAQHGYPATPIQVGRKIKGNRTGVLFCTQ